MKKRYRAWRLAGSLLLVLLACSCTLSKKVGKVLMDPDIQVGSAKEQASLLYLDLLADADINRNESDEATPVSLQVIYMSEDSKLLALDFDQLSDEKRDLADLLGKNYLDHQDYTLLPGQFKPLRPRKLEEKAQYIGVIAWFSDENSSDWKKIAKVNGTGHVYHLLVHVKTKEIELQKEEE